MALGNGCRGAQHEGVCICGRECSHALAGNLLCCLITETQWMQLEGRSEEGVQQFVSAFFFVSFCIMSSIVNSK